MQANDPIIHLNVGGTLISTTRSTLTSPLATPSMLSAMLNNEHHLPSHRDESGRLFIDRDGERFRVLLNYLRSGTVHVIEGCVKSGEGGRCFSLGELMEEATFFGLEQLRERIRDEMERIRLEEELIAVSGKGGADGEKGGEEGQTGSPTSARQTASLSRVEREEDYRFTLDADF